MDQGTFWDGIPEKPKRPRGGSGGGWKSSEQKSAYMRQRKEKGICAKCSNRREPKRSLCAACLTKANEEAKARYQVYLEANRNRAREYQRKSKKDPAVREHINAQQRSRYLENPDHWRNFELKRHYGITLEEYRAMEAKQGGLCALCGKPPLVGKRAPGKPQRPPVLEVDHDHITKKVRGLLCHWCNGHVVAGIEKSGASLKQIAHYLGVPLG
jgi:hypothetical protein